MLFHPDNVRSDIDASAAAKIQPARDLQWLPARSHEVSLVIRTLVLEPDLMPVTHSPPNGRPPRLARRRGAVTFESILVLFVLVMASLAAVQFGLALIVKQAVSHAATVAAREAAKGADADELVCVVERILAGHRIEIGDRATLVFEDAGLAPQTRGTLPCPPPEEPEIEGDEVRVTVCVSLDGPPFVNILSPYGVDFAGRTFAVSSLATRE
jgi:hypothetical protein